MAIQPDLEGLVTLTEGSTAFTWTGPSLVSRVVREGEQILLPDKALILTIGVTPTEVDEGVLTDECPADAAGTDQVARIRYQSDLSRVTAATRDLLELLSDRAFFEPDAKGPLVGRDAYDTQSDGFSYLQTDYEGDSARIYFRVTDVAGTWAGPYSYATGPAGTSVTMADIFEAADPATGSDAATLAIDLNGGENMFHQFTIAGDRTLGFPTEIPNAGVTFYVKITQDGVGGRSLAFASGYETAYGNAVTIATAANAETLLCVVMLTLTRAAVFKAGQEFA